MDAGFPVLIADAEGRRLTPSVVHFPGEGEPLVGVAARRVRGAKPRETVSSIKRFMGRRGSELSQEEMVVTYPVAGKGGEPVRVELAGRAWSPEEISAEILKKLKADVERSLGEPVTRAVITVPAYFNDAQRNATKDAGRLAGFEVERIVNEPTAAALAYGLDRLKEKSKIAVYDLGGGTFDISILELNQGVFQVLSTNGNTRLVRRRHRRGADRRARAPACRRVADERRRGPRRAPARGGRGGEDSPVHRNGGSRGNSVRQGRPEFFHRGHARGPGDAGTSDRAEDARQLPALAERREAQACGPRRRDPRRRADAHAAGARASEGDFWPRAKHERESRRGGCPRRDAAGRHPRGRRAEHGAARRDAAVARHRDVRRPDERDHPAQHHDPDEGRRALHHRGRQPEVDEDPGAAGRTRVGARQLVAGHLRP